MFLPPSFARDGLLFRGEQFFDQDENKDVGKEKLVKIITTPQYATAPGTGEFL